MYTCVGLCERMSYGMYYMCIIGTRRSKSALLIKTCWILWIPNPVTLFCLSTSPSLFYFLSNRTSKQRDELSHVFCIKQLEWHAASGLAMAGKARNKMIKLIPTSCSSLLLMCTVRQSQSRHSVSKCHIKHSSALSVAGDCVCVCACVCVRAYVYVCEATLGLFLVVLEGCVLLQRKAGWRSSGSALILPLQEGYHSPFLPLPPTPHSRTHTRAQTHARTLTSPQEAAVPAADFHAFKSIPLWSLN